MERSASTIRNEINRLQQELIAVESRKTEQVSEAVVAALTELGFTLDLETLGEDYRTYSKRHSNFTEAAMFYLEVSDPKVDYWIWCNTSDTELLCDNKERSLEDFIEYQSKAVASVEAMYRTYRVPEFSFKATDVRHAGRVASNLAPSYLVVE